MAAPLCRYCGAQIKKRTTTFLLRKTPIPHNLNSAFWKELVVDSFPAEKGDCQRLTNYLVMSVTRSADRAHITGFTAWDGVSYVDKFFCDGNHAKEFAYVMANNGRMTIAYAKAAGLKTEKV